MKPKRLKLTVALESLDFSPKKLMARAGRVNKRYIDMLGSLPSSQFEEMVSRFPLERAACAGIVARGIEEMVLSPRTLATRAVEALR